MTLTPPSYALKNIAYVPHQSIIKTIFRVPVNPFAVFNFTVKLNGLPLIASPRTEIEITSNIGFVLH